MGGVMEQGKGVLSGERGKEISCLEVTVWEVPQDRAYIKRGDRRKGKFKVGERFCIVGQADLITCK